MKVWMKVTDDELQLPLAIADTVKELAIICGISETYIRVSDFHHRHGRQKGCYISVEIDWSEKDEILGN